MILQYVVYLFFLFQTVHAKTHEEVKQYFVNLAMECIKDYPVSDEDVQLLYKLQVPENRNAKCLLGCVYKRANYMDDTGMYNLEGATKTITTLYEDQPTFVENGKKLMQICQGVNSEAVSDGAEGCDRGVIIFKCMNENAPKLGFPMNFKS